MVWFRAEAAVDKTRWLDYVDDAAGGPKRAAGVERRRGRGDAAAVDVDSP